MPFGLHTKWRMNHVVEDHWASGTQDAVAPQSNLTGGGLEDHFPSSLPFWGSSKRSSGTSASCITNSSRSAPCLHNAFWTNKPTPSPPTPAFWTVLWILDMGHTRVVGGWWHRTVVGQVMSITGEELLLIDSSVLRLSKAAQRPPLFPGLGFSPRTHMASQNGGPMGSSKGEPMGVWIAI